MESIKIYRDNNIIYEFKTDLNFSDELGNNISVSFTVSSKNELDFKIGDYILIDEAKYEIHDPIDIEESNGVFIYPLVFYWPGYKLNHSIVTDEGATTFSYHGSVSDFMLLIINSLRVDYPEFILGTIEENGIIDLNFDNSSCMQALKDMCEAAKMEWRVENTVINVKRRIGQDTDYVFKYGKSGGGYSVKLSRVANTSIFTRMTGKGGTINLPRDYVSPDNPKRLNLGNEILEKNVDKYGIRNGVYINENIYPRLINKTVQAVEVPANPQTAASWKIKLDIPFDLAQYYADNETPLVEFQTGDLTGNKFEIVENSWNNTDKTLSIIVQEEEDGYRLPNRDRQPRAGDVFVLLNIYMPQSYVDEATEELRKATQDDLNRKCEPQYAPSIRADYRYIRKNNINLSIGDGINVKVGSRSIATRIIGINRSSSDNEINYELGDQILYSYDTKTNNTIEQIQATLKQLINIDDIKRLFYNLINQWYPKWFNQKLHKDADVEFNSVNAAKSVKTERVTANNVSSERFASGPLGEGYRINENGEAEFQNLTVRGTFSAFELLIQQIRAVGGQLLVSPASIKISLVEETETGYKCYFNTENGGIPNPFVINDQLIHQVFTGSSINRYWRLVTETGADYFILSKTDCEAGSGIPAPEDEIMLLGNRTDRSRQSSILISAYGSDIPFVAYYAGIDSFSLAGKEVMREGNLNGIVDKDFGQLSGFGIYASHVYLKGAFYLMSGKTIESAISDSVDSIQFGGVNLANNSKNIFLTGSDFPANSLREPGRISVTYNGTWNAYVGWRNFDGVLQSPGKEFTASVSIKTNKDASIFTHWQYYSASHGFVLGDSVEFKCTAGQWERFSYNATVPDYADLIEFLFILRGGDQQGLVVEYKDYMFEAGNKASGSWSPSVADQQNQIDDAKSAANAAQQSVMQVTEQVTQLIADNEGIKASVTTVEEKVDNARPGTVNYLNGSRLDTAAGWYATGGTIQVVQDEKFGRVVEYSRPQGGGEYQTFFTLPHKELLNTELVYYVIAKLTSNEGYWNLGGWSETFDTLNTTTANKIDLGNGWYQYWISFKSGDSIGGSFGINSIAGTWRFYAAGVLKGNKPASWSPSLSDQNAQIEREAKQKALGQSWSSGAILNDDPAFKRGSNGVGAYNNNSNGVVTVSRIGRLPDSIIADSGYNLQITTSEHAATPGFGGFTFSTPSRANAIYITRILAKIPVGARIVWTTNAIGDGAESFWATQNKGTGNWEEYIVVVKCGSSGSFSSTNYFYLSGEATFPLTWYLAYAAVFDVTSSESLASQEAGKAKNEAISTAAQDAQAKADAAKNESNAYTDSKTVKAYTIDARGLDENKYYPVTIYVPPSKKTNIEVSFSLGGVVPSWATHGSGYSVLCKWSTNGSGWGTIPVIREITDFTYAWSRGPSCGSIDQMTNSSNEYIYVRGGGFYYFEISDSGGVPSLHSDTFTISGQTIYILDSVSAPVPTLETVRVELQSQVNVLKDQINITVSRTEYDANNATLRSEIGQIRVDYQSISATVTNINNRLGTVETAGYITTAQGNTLFASKTLEDGSTIVSKINQTADSVKIDAKNINLNGNVTANGNVQITTDGRIKAINAEISGILASNDVTITGGKFMGFELTSGWMTSSHDNYSIRIAAGYDNTEQTGQFSKAHIYLGSPEGSLYLNDPLNQGWMIKLAGSMQQYNGYIDSAEVRTTILKTNTISPPASTLTLNGSIKVPNLPARSGSGDWRTVVFNRNTGQLYWQ